MSISSFIGQNLVTLLIFLLVTEIVSLILVVYCFFKLAAVKRKSEVFFEGKNGKNLEELVLKSILDIKSLDSEIQELYSISNTIHNLSLSSIHRVGIVRFNPFGDIGGDQSFSVALLDGKNSGVVVSSLHTREGTRVYAKPVDKGKAEKYPLTEEEKRVIKIAMQNKPSKVQIIMDNEESKTVKLPASIAVKKLSEVLGIPVSKIITELMKNKILATINEEIDFETASIIAQDLGFNTKEDVLVSEKETITLEKLVEISKKEKEGERVLESRAPIVTILGHVDHGKTTLLDTIRKTSVAAKEAGGITQHISAYQVKKKGKWITFVDTPGHEAFSAMRERGVSIADIAVLVVAADDGVRPQTKEVITYLKEKKMPVIVAINKVDKPDANIIKVKQELADNGIVIEEWGGDVIATEVSAKQGIGIEKLLEDILLVNEVEDFKADFKRDGLAIILEAHLDPKKGPVTTVLVKTGILKVGQDIFAGSVSGRIKKMEDFSGRNINVAEPSMPITIMGFRSIPKVNDVLQIVSKKASYKAKNQSSGVNVKGRIESEEDGTKKLKIILKTDVQGSLEAIEQILSAIKSEEVSIQFISTGVGNITESDVKTAESAKATIFGFNVFSTPVANRLAEGAGIKIKTYSIIYELVEDMRKMLSDLLPVEIIRIDLGTVKVLAIFKNGKKEMIVGGRVNSGKIFKGENLEIKRDGEIIGKGKLANLQQNKENTMEVNQGNECGVTFEGSIKIKEGDTLICYKEEENKRKL